MDNSTKKRTLHENGTLNPHPHRVTDPLFTEHGFFDADDLLQVKYEMLRHVQSDGWSITKAASHFGFSRVAYYQLDKGFRDQGLGGLFPKKRGPKGPHKLTKPVLDFIQKAQIEEPDISSHEAVVRIQERFGISVHVRTLDQVMGRSKKKR